MKYYMMGTPCETLPNNIGGIYVITNEINQKIYVGQSNNIKRRIQEHCRSAQPDKYSMKSLRDTTTPIHRAMQKYGIDNFSINILEECDIKQLDQKEQFWVEKLNSNNLDIGYNLTIGGQKSFSKKGEQHSQAKLSQVQVAQIKKLLIETDLSYEIIASQFNVSKANICAINRGNIWKDLNEVYPLRKEFNTIAGEQHQNTIISDCEVMEMRLLYSQGNTFEQIVNKYSSKYSKYLIRSIIYGESHKNLPIWNNTQKIWK